jgi:hypothetical protein
MLRLGAGVAFNFYVRNCTAMSIATTSAVSVATTLSVGAETTIAGVLSVNNHTRGTIGVN